MRQTLSLGPFLGGLNNAANTPDTIADDELFECIDFDYSVDGTLITRPPVAAEIYGPDNTLLKILGFFVDPNTDDTYLFFTAANKLYVRAGNTLLVSAGSATEIGADFSSATCAIQYLDTFYIIRQSGGAGGAAWTVSGGLVTVADMPDGDSVALFKERMWIASGKTSRLYFSGLADPTVWNSSDFADVDAGNGQTLNAIYAGPSSLFLFKTNSTYVLTYDAAPTRGAIQNISTTIGLFNNDCITSYEGTLFILYGERVYSLQGYTFSRVSEKLDFSRNTVDVFSDRKYALSTLNDRIAVSYYNKTYIFYPLTNTWTEWALKPVTKWFTVPKSLQKYGYNMFMTTHNVENPSTTSIFVLQDKEYDDATFPDTGISVPRIKTKMYTFGNPEQFKRLYWWGIDAIVTSAEDVGIVKLLAIPYNFSTNITWQQLAGNTWGSLLGITWLEIETEPSLIFTKLEVDSPDRKYIKANRSLRFSRIQYRIEFPEYAYTAASSINHIVMHMDNKQDPVARSEGTPV